MLTISDSGDAVRQGFASCSARNPGKVVTRLHLPAMSPSEKDTARAYGRRLPGRGAAAAPGCHLRWHTVQGDFFEILD